MTYRIQRSLFYNLKVCTIDWASKYWKHWYSLPTTSHFHSTQTVQYSFKLIMYSNVSSFEYIKHSIINSSSRYWNFYNRCRLQPTCTLDIIYLHFIRFGKGSGVVWAIIPHSFPVNSDISPILFIIYITDLIITPYVRYISYFTSFGTWNKYGKSGILFLQ